MSFEGDIYIDCETDGLDPTVVWCVCAMDSEGAELTTRNPKELQLWLGTRKGGTVYAHNGIKFDYPVLTRLMGIRWDDFRLRDTMVLSYLFNPSLDGGHSLESWGERLKFPKGSHSDWSQWSQAMQDYCVQDVKVLRALVEFFKKENMDPRSVELEHEVAEVIRQQVINGFKLDTRACFMLLAQLKEKQLELEDEVRRVFVPLPTPGKTIEPRYKKDGTLSTVGIKCMGEDCLSLVCGPFSRVDYTPFNLGSRQQIGRHLQYYGWKPTVFTDKGQPKVDETVLDGVDIPQAALIAEYLSSGKRVGLAQSWLEAADENDRVHGDVIPCGAITGRMTHNSPNMGQIPKPGKPYGKECRSVWTVEPGYKLVGCDAEGLELRMLAHYMNDPEYIKTVVEGNKDDGTDVHTVNQRATGLATRDQAKTFIYAFLYGAGDAKIGSIIGGSAAEGRKLKAKFLRATPALSDLRDKVEHAARRGYLLGLDGRKLHVRSSHAALNTLLQGGGAIVMKRAQVLLSQHIIKRGLDAKFVATVHDEFNNEVREDQAATVAWLGPSCIAAAGKYFNLRCPLAGKAAIGNTWYDVH